MRSLALTAWLAAAREVTIPLAFSKCEETGRYRNFEGASC